MSDTTSLPFPPDVLLEHRAWVRALARSLVRDPAAADDLEQDTLVRALESMPADTRSPRAWLATVLRNRFRDNLRTRERRKGRERRAARTGAHVAAADIAMAAELHRGVLDAVLALDPPRRDVVLLRYFDGLTPAEIAERQGIPTATVRTRLHRGLARLRQTLDDRHGGDGHGWKAALAPLLAPTGAGGPDMFPPRRPWRVPLAIGAGAAAVALLALVVLSLWGNSSSRSRTAVVRGTMTTTTTDIAATPSATPSATPRRERERVSAPSSAGRAGAAPGTTTAPEAADPDDAAVRVSVVDSADQPVAGARVEIVNGNSFAKTGFGRVLSASDTDAGGAVAFATPGVEEVRIVARHGDLAAITPVMPREDALAAAPTLRLSAASTLRGVLVSSADGSPIVGARVALMLTGDVFGPGGVVRSAKDGSFAFASLPRTAFTTPANLAIVAEGFPHTNQPATRADATGPGMRVELAPAVTMTGRCVDAEGEPIAAVWVSSTHSVRPVESGADGRFSISGIDSSDDDRPVAVSFECDSHAPRRIEMTAAVLASGVLGDVVLDDGLTLSGRVVDRDGRPVPRASVYAEGHRTQQIARQGQTDDDGCFVFAHVADEPHDVVAQGPDDDSFSGLAGVLHDVRPAGEDVVITISGALTVLVEFVNAETSEPIALTNVLVYIEPLAGDEDDEAGSGVSSDDGFETVRIRAERPGAYKLTVRSFDGWGEFVAERIVVSEDDEVRVRAPLRRE